MSDDRWWRGFDSQIVDALSAGARFLDVGCGDGGLVERLVERGLDAVGVDPRAAERPRLADAIAGINAGAIVTTRGTPFAPGSIRNLEADYRNHVAPFFANARLNEIDRGALQRWIRGLSSGSLSHLTRPLSPSAVANCLKPLRLVYRVQRGNDASFSEDPFAGLQLPREHSRRERAMPLADFSKRIAALPDDELRLIYGLAGYAGLRLGEIQSLTAEHVGPAAIEVVTGYDAYAGVRARPKTQAGQRVVPIIPPLRRLLDAHLASSGITHGLLFPSRTQPGRALDKRAIHRVHSARSRSWASTLCARTMHATVSAPTWASRVCQATPSAT